MEWKQELTRLLLALSLAAIIGWASGTGAIPVALLLAGITLWYIKQLAKLDSWIDDADHNDPPESRWLWGSILDRIHELQKQQKSARRELQSHVDYFRDSFASLPDAVVMVDPFGNIEWSNRAANTLLGLRTPADNGLQLVNLLRDPAFIRYYESEDYEEDVEINAPNNPGLRLSIRLTFFGTRSRLLFCRDITRTFQLEQMRKDFVANVSHELRTPLTVISGYLETLSDQEAPNPLWAKAITQMSAQSMRMQALVNDVMVLSRLETVPRRASFSAIDIAPMMLMLKEEAEAVAEGHRDIHIRCDDSYQLWGCEDEIRSAFSNLVVNAARYTSDGDEIAICWVVDQHSARFEVSDTGIGIEPQHIPRLTERFYRVDDSRASSTGGTGLGLAIVKHVLLRHKAELQVTSVYNGGSTFSCVFPLTGIVRKGKPQLSVIK